MGRKSKQKDKRGSATEIPAGFTLIELLAVIAIITLQKVIVIPVVNRAQELGQRAVCLCNLRQFTLAWILYAEEHDSRLVSGRAFAPRFLFTERSKGHLGQAGVFRRGGITPEKIPKYNRPG